MFDKGGYTNKKEIDLKLRFIELLFIVAIFLTGLEQTKSTSNSILVLAALFLLGGLLYYILLISDITRGRIFNFSIWLASLSFSGVLAVFLGITFSSEAVAFAYLLIISLLLILTLSEKGSLIRLVGKFKKTKKVKDNVKDKARLSKR